MNLAFCDCRDIGGNGLGRREQLLRKTSKVPAQFYPTPSDLLHRVLCPEYS